MIIIPFASDSYKTYKCWEKMSEILIRTNYVIMWQNTKIYQKW